MNICIKSVAFLAALALAVAGRAAAEEPASEGQAAKPSVKTAKLEVPALAQRIDKAVQQKLEAEKVPASAVADDAEFLRRVYLDITGVIPSAEKVAAFLDSKDPEKRAKLIDELLASPQYGKHMADIWQAMLLPRNSDNRALQRQPMVKWLEDNFNNNTPWDKMVADLVTAGGTQAENGATTFFVANPTADKVNDTVSRLFLGIQLQCAQCHDHPFTGWKQNEYWGMAAFFTKVQTGAGRPQAGTTSKVTENGNGKQKLPDSAKIVPAKFLQGEEPKFEGSAARRPVLATWLTSADNQFFARAMVNRTWFHFFGRGFVNPVDDMHKDNHPSHPELLAELSDQLVASGFDLKHVIRGVCNSQTYQRTSKPVADNEDDYILFSHMAVKPFSPEQLFDSLEAVTGKVTAGPAQGRPVAGRPIAGTPRQAFIAFFQTDEGADPTEYQHGIPQALRLMNSPLLNRDATLLNEALKLDTPEKVIEHLYLGTLGRRPSETAMQRMLAHVKKNGDSSRKAYGDIIWALLNCSEFTLNH